MIEDLRNHLFATIEGLLDPDKPLDIERAKAVADVGRVMVDSAKAEVEYLKVTGQKGTGFIAEERPALEGPAPSRTVTAARRAA